MGGSGERLTYGELEDASNRVAQLLRAGRPAHGRPRRRAARRTGASGTTSCGERCGPASTSPRSTSTSPRPRPATSSRDCGARALVRRRRAGRHRGRAWAPTSTASGSRLAVGGRPRRASTPYADRGRRLTRRPDRRRGARARGCSTRRARPGGPRASSRRCGGPARRAETPFGSLLIGPLRVHGRHRLPQPGAALPRRPRRLDDDDPAPRRHRGRDGALRRRGVARPRRAPPRDPHAARAHPPRPPAEAARGGAPALRPVEPAACRARRRALPAGGQAGGDRVARADRLRVLLRAARAAGSAPSGPRSGWRTRVRSAARSWARCTSSATTARRCRPARRARCGSSAATRFEYHGDAGEDGRRPGTTGAGARWATSAGSTPTATST